MPPPVDDPAEILNRARDKHRQGMLVEASELYVRLLQINPQHVDALNLLGVLHRQTGNPSVALPLFDAALAQNPTFAGLWNNRALALSDLGRTEEAIQSYIRAIELKPVFAEAHCNLGNVYLSMGRYWEALTHYDSALQINPGYAEAWNNRGNALQRQMVYDEARRCYDRALQLLPDYADALSNRAAVLMALKCFDEALADAARAVQLAPALANAFFNLGNALFSLARLDEALVVYDHVLSLDPGWLDARNNRGCVLVSMRRFDEALAEFDLVLSASPDNADAWYNRGNVLREQNRFDEALPCYEKAIKIQPDYPYAIGFALFCRQALCDWNNINQDIDALLHALDEGRKVTTPFLLLTIPSTLEQQRRCACIYVQDKLHSPSLSVGCHSPESGRRLKVGYFSADFQQHATSILMAELFERHDRSEFEIFGFSYGPAANEDAMRRRLKEGFDHFYQVDSMSDRDLSALVRSLNIDIAVDLKGHTTDARLGLFAYRMAPIQVHYLGYPGTLCCDFIDYLVADPVVIPVEASDWYAEKIAWLPHCYQVNDRQRRIVECPSDRAQWGLPAQGMVFCCFNNAFKILLDTFACWMQILIAVPGSVLWLLQDHPQSSVHLCAEAERAGVGAHRLIFASRSPHAQHLERHRHADLFLDTFHCNAHTTASDALWAGLPVLTCPGQSFVSRVAASLLTGVGLPELIAKTPSEYVEMAIALANNPDRLNTLKSRLAAQRNQCPLFDTPAVTRDLEDLYRRMWQRYTAGLPPESLLPRQ